MNAAQTKSEDRFQYIGLVGPLIILLTLFCTLLKGSPKSSYLFFVVAFSLPAMWQWRMKGLLASLSALTLFLISFYPFFASQEKFWQVGAALSIGLGLFVTYSGLEELRKNIERLQLESQSRLENLINLDEKYNLNIQSWKNEQRDFNERIEYLESKLKKVSEDEKTLQQLSKTLRLELEEEQSAKEKLLQDIEEKVKRVSLAESKALKSFEEYTKIEKILEEDRSERELKALEELEAKSDQLKVKEDQISHLQAEMQTMNQELREHKSRAKMKDEAFNNMQVALREKVSAIHELNQKLHLQEQEQKQQVQEVSKLFDQINQKEHELLTLKEAIKERDLQLQTLNQKQRDLLGDLETARSYLEEKKKQLADTENALKQKEESWQHQVSHKEHEIESKTVALGELNQKLSYAEDNLVETQKEVERLKKQLLYQKEQHEEMEKRDQKFKDEQFNQLKKLNDARFALFQASMDKERLKKEQLLESRKEYRAKHWLLQLEQLLKGDPHKKINFSKLPQDLSEEILNLNQTKALYKQLREQFDEKNEILEETRKELFHLQTQGEAFKKKVEQAIDEQREPEKYLQKSLEEQSLEIKGLEEELLSLSEIISNLIKVSEKN